MTIQDQRLFVGYIIAVVSMAAAIIYASWQRSRMWSDRIRDDIDRARELTARIMRDMDNLSRSVMILNDRVAIITTRLEALENPPLRKIEVPDEPFDANELPSLREV